MALKVRQVFLLALALLTVAGCKAPPTERNQFVRWTGKEDSNPELSHILRVIHKKTGFELKASDFTPFESIDLAREHFSMLLQTSASVPIEKMSIRIWTDLKTGRLVQLEANLLNKLASEQLPNMLPGGDAKALSETLSNALTRRLVLETIRASEDPVIRSVKWRDVWSSEFDGALVRVVEVKGKRGVHEIVISTAQRKVIRSEYHEFPRTDVAQEFSIPAQVYPIYEEVEGKGIITERIPVELKYIQSHVARVSSDPYESLRNRRYLEEKMNPVLGETPEGQAQGFWSMADILRRASAISTALPLSENSFAAGGVLLQGRYATVSLHPDVLTQYQGINFTPMPSSQFKPNWVPTPENGDLWEMIPRASLLGKPILSLEDAWNRPARRLSDHNPVGYINDGFDELQVYYAINTLFDSLRSMGFTDPELSTRPFHAFLYDPDISMRDNAFYTDDTINFTTYSPNAINFARDNSTIWHELGHGVMDRLMGSMIHLADTGGLSEGMADFVADLVISDLMRGKSFEGYENFRIINKTGFYLTNESHDDGEAYGGALKDFLTLAVQRFGWDGLAKVADLTLEAMRLSRNHPALTASDWFQHMLFADELGSGNLRKPGELGDLITQAVEGRNFDLKGKTVASFELKNGDEVIQNTGPGSRGSPVVAQLAAEDSADYHLQVSVHNGAAYSFKFPVTVKVFFRSGPLQGAVRWEGEEQEPKTYTIHSETEVLPIDLKVHGQCDFSNREDGSCVDYAYVQVWNQGETSRPQAKKRFYVRVKN